MIDFSPYLVNQTTSVYDALARLDVGGKGILFVVNENKLQGTLTDGDIRRHILRGGSLTEKVNKICNQTPSFIFEKDEFTFDKGIFAIKKITAIPVIDDEKRIIKIIFADSSVAKAWQDSQALQGTSVVIMAGGQGTRLYPFTKILPKPLIPIGDKPISVHIIEKFCEYGATDFIFSVNYKSNMIKAYFNDAEMGYNVGYIEEEKPLGTGGSLHLLKDKLKKTFIVVNCDILINANYAKAMDYHKEHKNKITIIGAVKDYQIPYGVLEFTEKIGTLAKIKEKPTFHFTVNTGMYILEPEVLDLIPNNEFFHITHLIEKLLAEEQSVGVFPIHGQAWLDMGQFEEMKDMMQKLGVS